MNLSQFRRSGAQCCLSLVLATALGCTKSNEVNIGASEDRSDADDAMDGESDDDGANQGGAPNGDGDADTGATNGEEDDPVEMEMDDGGEPAMNGDTRCGSDNDVETYTSRNETWSTTQNCLEACSEGECVCTPGAAQCVDNKTVQVCNDNDAFVSHSCASCVADACNQQVTICTDDNLGWSSSYAAVLKCGDKEFRLPFTHAPADAQGCDQTMVVECPENQPYTISIEGETSPEPDGIIINNALQPCGLDECTGVMTVSPLHIRAKLYYDL